jgi:hypothetical protein
MRLRASLVVWIALYRMLANAGELDQPFIPGQRLQPDGAGEWVGRVRVAMKERLERGLPPEVSSV